jgi:hypothetical protein
MGLAGVNNQIVGGSEDLAITTVGIDADDFAAAVGE